MMMRDNKIMFRVCVVGRLGEVYGKKNFLHFCSDVKASSSSISSVQEEAEEVLKTTTASKISFGEEF